MSLPPELHKEIIFWAVGPHARGSLPVGPHHAALASDKERERDRRELRDRRMTLIQVCRAWKRASRAYLYEDPHLPSLTTLALLAQSLLRADKLWDDLRGSRHSLPGAYVRVLDLSHVAASSSTSSAATFNPWQFATNLSTLLPLVPNLKRLILPSPENYMLGATTLLRLLNKADFPLASLTEVENVPVFVNGLVTSDGLDPVVELVQELPNLQRLGVVGGGAIDFEDVGDGSASSAEIVPVDAPHLSSLSLRGIPSGLLLRTLLFSSLTSLRHLDIATYNTHRGDQTTAFLDKHGSKLRSLDFLHLPDFPTLSLPLPADTLQACSNLVNITFHSLPNPLPFTPAEFFGHPALHLQHITLPRPPRASSSTYKDLILYLCSTSNLPSLRTVSISPGFSWLPTPFVGQSRSVPSPLASPTISAAATQAGLNGIIRQYALYLGRRGVVVLDSRGRGCPGLTLVGGQWVEAKQVGHGWKGSPNNLGAGGWRERRRSTEEDEESEGGG